MNIQDEIVALEGCDYFPDADLSKFTTIRLSSRGNLIEVYTVLSLQKLLPLFHKYSEKYLVIGWGANQILPSRCEAFIIHLKLDFDSKELEFPKEEYHLPASVGLNHLTAHAVKFGLKGWEVFTGIPASLGGAIFMNAGTNLGEIGKIVKKVQLVTPEGKRRESLISQDSFSYRKNHFVKEGEVIVGAVLKHEGIDGSIPTKIREYLDYRKRTQPLATRNCGCVFKNPFPGESAGRMIDQLGIKGLSVGGLRISEKHANFIENTGTATWDDFSKLISVIRHNIDVYYGIEFELEVKIPYH